jgi:DNA repair protein RadC
MEQEINISAIMNVSEIELVYKSKVKPSARPKIITSKDAHAIFLKYWNENKIELVEEFYAMFLNRANRVLGIYHLSSGGISGTVADPRLIFIAALKLGSSYCILCHNHPSSNLKPSHADKMLTEKIKQGGKILEINLLDHLIITEGHEYFSFADEGLI